MSAKRWQIVGGWVFGIINVTILDFTVSPPHPVWSWWTALAIVVFVVSYQVGGHAVRRWQAAK